MLYQRFKPIKDIVEIKLKQEMAPKSESLEEIATNDLIALAKDYVADSPAKELSTMQSYMQPLKSSRPELEMNKLNIDSLS